MKIHDSLVGTIIVAVKCVDYVILAVDSQCHHVDEAEDFSDWQYKKITLHESLPLAIANGGYAFLETTDYPVASRIDKLFREFGVSKSPPDLFEVVVADLSRVVRQKCEMAEQAGIGAMNVTLYAGMIEA